MKAAPKIKILKSKYFDSIPEIPLSEYPRPQLQRDSYLCLNGEWDYATAKIGEKLTEYQRKIKVPFSPESLIGGGDEPNDYNTKLFYKRTFTLEKDFIKDKTILHLGAVDYSSSVYVNGRLLSRHRGGYLPFSVDISSVVKAGENKLEVTVKDPTDKCAQARGKQKTEHGQIWYTPQSGIWGSVWLESVSRDYIKDITVVPDIDNDCINIKTDTDAESVSIEIYDDGTLIASDAGKDCSIPLESYQLWSPENPKLYDIVIKTEGDTVRSYFGMRKFSVGKDEQGISRLMLNNRPYFHNGILDQGYWSDGMLTPPSDEAMLDDIRLAKAMGYNMLRKHIKIEPLRWYYHCDREGMLVWQDMVNGGGQYSFAVTAAIPFTGIHFKDDKYKLFAREDSKYRDEFINEVKETVQLLKNSVSLSMWVIFNEGWGQFDSDRIAELVQFLDSTRTIDRTSGWHDQKSGDFISKHIYFTKIRCPRDKRCFLLSEFGGYSHACKGHVYRKDKIFGYKVFEDTRSMQRAFEKLYENSIIPNIEKGLSAAVYTQLSDVEEETNGFITYDREVVKFDVERVRAINERVRIAESARTVENTEVSEDN